MRVTAIALVLLSLSCTVSTSRPAFAPADDSEAPAGLDLSVVSVARDGTIELELRNYSIEPFVFYGSPAQPRLEIEFESEAGRLSRHKLIPWKRGQKTHELAPGERLTFKTKMMPGGGGRIRIGLRSHDFGFIVWTPPIAFP